MWPFGATEEQPWSLPAIGMAGTALAFLEPDPAAEWHDRRLVEIHQALAAWSGPPDPQP